MLPRTTEELQAAEDLYHERRRVARNMKAWGGGFVKALGAALSEADDNNCRRIKEAFPEYWRKYDK